MGLIQNYIDKRVANFFDNMDLKTNITGKIYNDELYELQENRIWYKRGLRDGVPIALGYFAVAFTLGIVAKNAGWYFASTFSL